MRPGRKPRDTGTQELTAPVPGLPDLNLGWNSGLPYHDDHRPYPIGHSSANGRPLLRYRHPDGTLDVLLLLQLIQATFHGGLTWSSITTSDVIDGNPLNHVPSNFPDLTLPRETWMLIPSQPGAAAYRHAYAASNLGRVSYLERSIRYLIHDSAEYGPYPQVNLRHVDAPSKYEQLSHVVLRAWKGMPPSDDMSWDVDHMDRDTHNNRPENLRYLDVRGNRGKDTRLQRPLLPESLTVSQLSKQTRQGILKQIVECDPEHLEARIEQIAVTYNLAPHSLRPWLDRNNPNREPRTHRPSDDLKEQALRLYDDGSTLAQITNVTGLASVTLKRLLASSGRVYRRREKRHLDG